MEGSYYYKRINHMTPYSYHSSSRYYLKQKSSQVSQYLASLNKEAQSLLIKKFKHLFDLTTATIKPASLLSSQFDLSNSIYRNKRNRLLLNQTSTHNNNNNQHLEYQYQYKDSSEPYLDKQQRDVLLEKARENSNKESLIHFLNYYYQNSYQTSLIYYNNLILAVVVLFILFSILIILEENDSFYNLSALSFLLLVTFNLILIIFAHNLAKQFTATSAGYFF